MSLWLKTWFCKTNRSVWRECQRHFCFHLGQSSASYGCPWSSVLSPPPRVHSSPLNSNLRFLQMIPVNCAVILHCRDRKDIFSFVWIVRAWAECSCTLDANSCANVWQFLWCCLRPVSMLPCTMFSRFDLLELAPRVQFGLGLNKMHANKRRSPTDLQTQMIDKQVARWLSHRTKSFFLAGHPVVDSLR